MNRLALIADVHISPLTVAALKSQNYAIQRTTELLPANATDREILELARIKHRVVLTQDLDFSMLVALSNYDQPSLITLRLSFGQPNLVTQRLLEVLPSLQQELMEGSVVTISDNAVRIRKLPIR